MSAKAFERRLKEARNHIKTGHYRSAVESAGGGVELLMKVLYDELIDKLKQDDGSLANHLQAYYVKFSNRNKPEDKLMFGEWIDFFKYEKTEIFDELVATLKYPPFKFFNEDNLYTIKELRNDCSHEDYQPSRDEAEFVCNHLALFLEETNRAPVARQDHEWTKDWHKKWDDRIENWLKQPKHVTQKAVSALADQFRLVVDLIDDEDVPRELKTQLMWAVIYVIEPDDIISEKLGNVPTLVDDAAVLVLTLYWLDKNDIIERETLRAHWHGKRDVITVTYDLYDYIVENYKSFRIKDEEWEIIGAIAEKGPRVLWQMLK